MLSPYFEPEAGLEPAVCNLVATVALRQNYPLFYQCRTTDKENDTLLVSYSEDFNQTHHQFPLTRDYDFSTQTTVKPLGCTWQKARFYQQKFEALCTIARNCYFFLTVYNKRHSSQGAIRTHGVKRHGSFGDCWVKPLPHLRILHS